MFFLASRALPRITVTARNTQGDSTGGHVFRDYRIGADGAVVANNYLPDDLGAGADKHAIADTGGTAGTTPVTNGHPMVEGAVFTDFDSWVKNDATKVVYLETFPNSATGRDGNPGSNLDKPLAEKAKRLPGNPPVVQPVEKTIDQYRLKALRQKSGK